MVVQCKLLLLLTRGGCWLGLLQLLSTPLLFLEQFLPVTQLLNFGLVDSDTQKCDRILELLEFVGRMIDRALLPYCGSFISSERHFEVF